MHKWKKYAVTALASLTVFASGCGILGRTDSKGNPVANAVERFSDDSDISTEYINATPADETKPEVVQYYDKMVTKMLEDARVTTDSEFTVESNDDSSEISDTPADENRDEEPAEIGDTSLRQLADERGQKLVAVIDTGVNEYAERTVNFTNDGDSDNNGHGTEMARHIVENADGQAMILGLKAIGDSGRGYMSDIMQAAQYAVDQKVDIINLSISALASSSTEVFADQIRNAVDSGITVVAAAGNYNSSAALYVPANIEGVLSVGAVNENGEKIETSNYNADYYETADSTSSASAILAGKIARGADLSGEISSNTVHINKENINSSIVSPCDTETMKQKDGSMQYRMYYDVNVSKEALSEIYKYDSKYYITSESDISDIIPAGHMIYDSLFNGYNYAFDSDEEAEAAWDAVNAVENGPMSLFNEKDDMFEVQYNGSDKTCNQHPAIHRWWLYLDVSSYGDSGVHWDLGIANSVDSAHWATYDFSGSWNVNIGGCAHSGTFYSKTFGAGGRYDSFTRSFGVDSGDCSGKYGAIKIHADATCDSAGLDNGSGVLHFKGTSTLDVTYETGHVQSHAFDLNAVLDGTAKSGLSDFGTADVTVGNTSKTGIQDYYDGAVKHGTSYSVKNIKAKTGYTLTSTNSYSGTVNGDVSVAPTFVTNTYTVVFNGNGNSGGSTAKQTYTYFENKALTANGFTKTGYVFNGWNTAANGTGTAYKDKQSVSKLAGASANKQTVNLYAQWKPAKYKIVFDPNGGVGNTAPIDLGTYDTSAVLTANGYSRVGYDFTGWNTQSTGKGTAYANKATVKNLTSTNGGTVTLYAQWKAHQYDVIFNSNAPAGYTANNSMANQHFVYDASQTLTKNAFTVTKAGTTRKTDFAFDGWSLTPDGEAEFTDGQVVKNLTAVNNGKVNLYAKWRPLDANVVYKNYNLNNRESIVSGVTYKLQGTSYYGDDVVQYAVSANDGTVTFKNVPISSSTPYTVSEVTPAYNFATNKNKWIANVVDQNAYAMGIKSGSDRNYYAYINSEHRVYSEPLHSFTVLKKNSYNFDTVQGVTFRLSGVGNDGTAYDKSVTTNSGGSATFSSVPSGTFTLVETAVSSSGTIRVELDDTPRAVTIDDAGNTSIQGITTVESGKFVIVDKAIANGTVTVIKKWVDLEGENIDHSKSFPTIHIGTGNPTVNSIAHLNKTNWRKIYSSGITDVVHYTANISKSDVEAKGATKINETAETKVVYAWKEGTRLYWWSNASNVFLPADSSEWYANNASLKTIDADWDTANVTSMKKMFEGCTSLTKVDVGNDTRVASYANNGAMATAGTVKYMLISDADSNGIVSKGDLIRGDSRMYKSYSSQPLTFIVINVSNGSYELMARENYKNTPYNATSAVSKASESRTVNFDEHKVQKSKKASQGSLMDSFMITAYAATEYKSTGNYYNPSSAGGKTPAQMFGTNVGSGYWTKIDDKTYSYTFYITDASASYYVWEDDVDGYTSNVTDTKPKTIKSAADNVVITNTTTKTLPKYGTLTVRNTVSSSKTTDYNSNYDYTYTIRLTKSDGSAVSGTMMCGDVAFVNGVGHITLKQDGSKTIWKIPDGYRYSVAQDPIEINKDIATVDVTSRNAGGSISSSRDAQCEYVVSYDLKVKKDNKPASFKIINSMSLSSRDTANKGSGFTYVVSISNLTPGKKYFYNGAVSGSCTADANGEAVVEVRLTENQSETFTVMEGVKYSITSIESSSSSTSYSGTTTKTLKQASGSASTGKALSTALETAEAYEDAAFTFNHQFRYSLTVNSSITGKTAIRPAVQLNFPASMKNRSLGAVDSKDSNFTRLVIDGSAHATVSLENGKKIVISGLTGTEIDAIASGTLFSAPKYDGYTVSVSKSQGTDGNMTSAANYAENKYSITYHGNGAGNDTAVTESVYYTENHALKANPYTKTGYVFSGWNTAADGTGTGYTDRQTVSKLASASANNQSIHLYAQWIPVTYSVKYSGNGSTAGSMTDSSYTYDKAGNLSPNKFEKKYTVTFNYNFAGLTNEKMEAKAAFNGWKGSNGKTYADSASVTNLTSTNGGSVTMTAQWTPASIKLSAPERLGYTFDGWYTAASGGTKIGAGGASFTPVGNTTYYAHWTPITYTIKFAGNGNTGGSTASMSVKYDQSATLTANGFTKSGYSFAGWSCDETKYENKASVKNLASANGASVTLTAVWLPTTYQVSFDPNGGSGAMNPQTFTYDAAQALTKNTFKRTGYTFIGWSDTQGENIVIYRDQESVKNVLVSKLYAVWQRNTYTDSIAHWSYGFKNQEGNNNDKNAFQLGTTSFKKGYGDKVTYTAADAVRIPNGFQLSSTIGSSSYDTSWKGYPLGTSFTQPDRNTYVQYSYNPVSYKITYSLDGGSNSGSNPSSYNVLYGVTFSNPSKKGYTFAGWYIDNVKVTGINPGANAKFTSSDDMYSKLASRIVGNKTVTAKWTPNTYTVSYNGNTNTGGSTESSTHTYDAEKSLTANGFTKTGYTFSGWNTKADGTGTPYADKATVKNLAAGGSVTLYAQWTVNTYYLDLNGWLDGASNGGIAGYGTADVYVNGVQKANDVSDFYQKIPYGSKYEVKDIKPAAGHTYIGVHSGSLTGTMGTSNTGVVLEFVTNKYTVAYDANGGTGSTASSSHTYDVAKTLTPNGFARTGYIFKGWNTAKDGKGTAYADKASVKNLSSSNNVTVTLYAQWTPKVLTATFHRNFDSSDTTSFEQKFTYEKGSQSFQANTWTRPGYIFKGWSTDKNATSAMWPDKCGVADGWINGNYPKTDIYAVWMPESYNWTVPSVITFDTNSNTNTKSGTVTVTDNTLASGRTLNIRISSSASFKLKDKANSANTRNYSVSRDGTALNAGSTVISLPTATKSGSQAISFSLAGANGAQVAGSYQDILRFTAAVE